MDLIVRCVAVQAISRGRIEFLQTLQVFGCCVRWMKNEAAPNLTLLEGSQRKLRDNTKIIASTSQRFVQIWMLVGTGNHSLTVCKDDL